MEIVDVVIFIEFENCVFSVIFVDVVVIVGIVEVVLWFVV